MIGVVYKSKPHKILNGSLFYCYEHYRLLKQYTDDVKFYLIDVDDNQLEQINTVLDQKYINHQNCITPISKIFDLYYAKLSKTLVLDMPTFNSYKEFFTGDVHCFANEEHDMYRYKDSRTVTYYGYYPYQMFDVKNMLKLNFDIFKPCKTNSGVFVSGVLGANETKQKYEKMYGKPVHMKMNNYGVGNVYDMVDHMHYVHTSRDKNNRAIPEAFFHNKTVTIERLGWYKELDSVDYRYEDIIKHGLQSYTLTKEDRMIQACLES